MSAIGTIFVMIILIRLIRSGNFAPWFWIFLAKLALIVGALVTISEADSAATLLLYPLLALLVTPTLVLAWIIVPLGMPRLTYWIVRLTLPLGYLKELGAAAVMYGALALTRKRRVADEAVAWLEQRLNREQRMRGAGVVAAGLLAALRRDREQARGLFVIADNLLGLFASRRVRSIARDWLVADAARIGDWRTVIRLGRRRQGNLRWSYAMARIAERLIGDKQACGNVVLCLCFLAAPRRLATYPLLRRALAVPVRPPAPEPLAASSLPQGLADLTRAIENRQAGDGASLAKAVAAVDGSLGPMRAHIERRLGALGGRGESEDVVSAFQQRLIEILVPLIEETPHLAFAAEGALLLDEAARQVRARLFRDVEARCKDYKERTADETSLDPVPEWASWAMLRRSADRLLELHPDSKIALFQAMYIPVTNFAVLQFNHCKRTPLAHDMFAWLLQHSQSNADAIQLLTKNVAAARA